VLGAWPESAPNGLGVITVNNALNNLLGYPHRQWRQLSREIDATERAVAQALLTWRGDDHRAPGGRGYFDSLM
jgi:hypothetical protein